jgi:hypothetical protein
MYVDAQYLIDGVNRLISHSSSTLTTLQPRRRPANVTYARRDAGESIEEVSRFLDHSSLAVTTTYLRRLEGQEDRS